MFHLPRAASTFPVSRPLPPDSTLERMPLNVKFRSFALAISALLVLEAGCGPQIVTTNVPVPAPSTESQRDTSKRLPPPPPPPPTTIPQPVAPAVASAAERLARYATVRLVADTTTLTKHERQMLPLLVAAAREMHGIFWEQAIGPRDSVLSTITDASERALAEVTVGPWDRLDGNVPFVRGAGRKPDGANFYPRDMTKNEFAQAVSSGGARADSLKSLYTMVRRGAAGSLVSVPYSRYFAAPNARAAAKLREAAMLADDAGLKRYLTLVASALVTDKYRPSDFAWMDMKKNTLDIVIGPIETYEDELFGYKAANEAFVLIKDQAWSRRLANFAKELPALQQGLPVDAAYRRERPGTDADLNAYDVVYVAGHANAGPKTIAINLPNDEEVQLKKGARRLQLKNAIRAKFDRILTPIAKAMIADDQLSAVTFDAFFENVMFHEVAHGLGIKNTIDGKSTVRAALKEKGGALEEGKADILGLYLIRQLRDKRQLSGGRMEDNLVTFLASLFRSVRFGAADAHGRANVVAFNYLQRSGAFTRDAGGKYRIDAVKMRAAADQLARDILTLQGNGDYAGVAKMYAELGVVGPTLQGDIDRLAKLGIPVDLIYEQP